MMVRRTIECDFLHVSLACFNVKINSKIITDKFQVTFRYTILNWNLQKARISHPYLCFLILSIFISVISNEGTYIIIFC